MKGDCMVRGKYVLAVLLVMLMSGISLFGCTRVSKQTSQSSIDVKSKYFSSEKVMPKARRARVTFRVDVGSFKGAKKVRMWLPYPVSNKHQAITNVGISGNYANSGIYSDGKLKNMMLYTEWTNPQVVPDISFSFDVKRSEIIKKDFPDSEETSIDPDIKDYLMPSGLVPTDGAVKETAEKIAEGKTSALAKSEAVYDYLVENYKRDDTVKGCGQGDVCGLLNSKKGKCADIHSVYVALSRSVGVPAREIFGIRIPKESEGDMTKAYHCIAEFYMPGYGWVPVDASDVLKLMLKENLKLDDPKVKDARSYFFGTQTANYVEFGTGRDITLNPPQEAGKLNYFMYPYVEVDGKALDYLSQKDFKYTVIYKEL